MELEFTVVTVCRNASSTIRTAIESVLHQKYDNFEYIVVDGLSTDHTYDIVRSYEDSFRERGIPFVYVSEKDRGIFDAMNKGASMASGKWISYINADDRYHSEYTLQEVKRQICKDADVVYGDTVRVAGGIEKWGKGKPPETIYRNMPFCHQSGFVKTELMKQRRFDLDYRVADYNFFLRSYMDGAKFQYIEVTVSDYSEEGYSNQNKYATYLGTVQIKSDLGLVKKNSIKQKLKNLYFKILLSEEMPAHWLITRIDKRLR